MEIIRYPFRPIDSSMYVMCGHDSAVIIDPWECKEALSLVRESGAKKVVVLLTHEHYDHISGVNWWKEQCPCDVICSKTCGERITDPKRNASAHYDVLFLFQPKEIQEEAKKLNFKAFSCEATQTFESFYSFDWEGHHFEITETPGHSPGSCCILLDGNICFTGDTVLKGVKTITRLPHGSRTKFQEIVSNYLKKLPDTCQIYPGHGDHFSIKEINFDLL